MHIPGRVDGIAAAAFGQPIQKVRERIRETGVGAKTIAEGGAVEVGDE
jgi:hypothetical protein